MLQPRAGERTEHAQAPEGDGLLVIVFHGPSLSGRSGHFWGDLLPTSRAVPDAAGGAAAYTRRTFG